MLLSPPLDAMIPPGPLALLNFNPHSPTATGQLVLFFTNSSVSSRSPPNSSPSSTRKSLPPPPSTRAALGIPPCLLPSLYGLRYGWSYVLSRSPHPDFSAIVVEFDVVIRCAVCVTWAGDFGCFPFPHGDGAQIVPEQPRRPQDHPLLGPCRQLGLRHRGTPLQFMLGFLRKSVRFVDFNNAPNVISQLY